MKKLRNEFENKKSDNSSFIFLIFEFFYFLNCEILELVQLGKFHNFRFEKFEKIFGLENKPISQILEFLKVASF